MTMLRNSTHGPRFRGGTMRKDSLETLLLRHYGNAAPTPPGLQEQILASVRHKAAESRQEMRAVAHLRKKRPSRRPAVKLVAIRSAGLGILSSGRESLQMCETALVARYGTQPARKGRMTRIKKGYTYR